MSTAVQYSDLIRQIVEAPSGGVVGLFDGLLKICWDHQLDLDCRPDHWRVRAHDGGWESLPGVAVPKSVFRAIVARAAALCNERRTSPISLYEGQGSLFAEGVVGGTFALTFANTPAEQRLTLLCRSTAPDSMEAGKSPM